MLWPSLDSSSNRVASERRPGEKHTITYADITPQDKAPTLFSARRTARARFKTADPGAKRPLRSWRLLTPIARRPSYIPRYCMYAEV